MNNIHCGIDIIEVSRIADIIKKNSHFLERVFTPREIAYCSNKKFKWEHFAVRFAAKEAVWKAIDHKGIRLQQIGVRNAPDGRPEVVIEGNHTHLARSVSISLSHTRHYAVAMALYKSGQKRNKRQKIKG